MKKEIFLKYIESILKQFEIDRANMISNNKKRKFSEARNLLYFMCNKRSIRHCDIIQYMTEEGYTPNHCQVYRGIKSVERKIIEDHDYKTIVSRLENAVFI